MLLLTFETGSERFATPAVDVLEVVPVVELKPIPLAEPWVAGVFDYRGLMTPVIDLCQVLQRRPCALSMSSRIMIVRHGGGTERPLGLVAERVTRMVNLDPATFQDAGVEVPAAPYLRGVGRDEYGLLQLVDQETLLPAQIAEQLFRKADAGRTPVGAGAQG